MKIRFKKDNRYNFIWDVQYYFLFFWWPTFKFVLSTNPTLENLTAAYNDKCKISELAEKYTTPTESIEI